MNAVDHQLSSTWYSSIGRSTSSGPLPHHCNRRIDSCCKGSLAAIFIYYYVIRFTAYITLSLANPDPIRFYSSTTKLLPRTFNQYTLVSFQYKGIRLYSDVTVRNKVEENRILTGVQTGRTTGRYVILARAWPMGSHQSIPDEDYGIPIGRLASSESTVHSPYPHDLLCPPLNPLLWTRRVYTHVSSPPLSGKSQSQPQPRLQLKKRAGHVVLVAKEAKSGLNLDSSVGSRLVCKCRDSRQIVL